MLESFRNSKLKKSVAGALLLFPKRGFSAREMAAMTRGGARAVTECLRELARAEAAEAVTRRGHRYWRLNAYFPHLAELRELAFAPKPRYEDLVTRALRRLPDVRLAVMTGIFTFQTKLPVDILVVSDVLGRPRLAAAIAEIGELIGQEVNYVLLSRAEYEERRFLSDRLIRDVLDHPHIVVFNNLRKG